ncbi:MAG: FecCD family ABC transporter permease [Flavobacteriales bacterium]
MNSISRYTIPLLVLAGALLFLCEIFLGPVKIGIQEVLSILSGSGDPSSPTYTIVVESRLPRACVAAVSGMGLAWSGWLMQTMFRNPLAGPGVLGISSGASLGVALLLLISGSAVGEVSTVIAAMSGAIAVLLIILLIANRLTDHLSLLLFGVMLGYFVSAIVSALQFKAGSDALKSFVLWGMGSFAEAGMADALWILALLGIAAIIILTMLKPLNLLLLGDEYARSLGVNLKQVRIAIVLVVGLTTGAITAFCGPVAFIGLVVPHLTRSMMQTSEHRKLFIPVAMMGVVCSLGSDVLARLTELPLNSIVSALGAPVVIYMIVKGSKSKALI